MKEDLVKRGKVRVYEYVWRADDGDYLRMVFDSQSWRPIEAENNELSVSCRLRDEKLVAGVDHSVKWEVRNKQGKPVQVSLSTSGDQGVDIHKRELLEVKSRAAIVGTFKIDPEIAEKTRDPKAALLNTSINAGGQELELSAGIQVQQAVEISLNPSRSVVTPGQPQTISLSLQSNLTEKSMIHLSVSPLQNASIRKRQHRLTLGARAGAELDLEVSVRAAGHGAMEVEAYAAVGHVKIPLKKKRLDLLAVDRSDTAAAVGEDSALIASGGLFVSVSLGDGGIYVHDRLRAKRAHRLSLDAPRFGPPFSWEDLFIERGEAEVDGDGIRLRNRSLLRPGLVLERSMRIQHGALVEVVDTVINGSGNPLQLERLQGWNLAPGRGGGRSGLTAPQETGVFSSMSGTGGRGLESIALPEQSERWPEGWLCRHTEDGGISAVLWGKAVTVHAGFGGEVKESVGRIEPGQAQILPPIYGLVSDGTWETARRWWRLLFGGDPPESEGPREVTRSAVELTLAPQPLVIAVDSGRATLQLESAGTFKLDGMLEVSCDRGLQTDFKTVAVKQLSVDKQMRRRVKVNRTRGATGERSVTLRFSTDEAVYHGSTRVLLIPRRARKVYVSAAKGGVAIDNGLLRLQVAPEFMGSVVSLICQGEEFLNSSYPEGGMRGWRNPWHGGLHPTCQRLWGRLHRERFRERVIERRGSQGLPWSGVRIQCAMKQEHARGQTMEHEYLLTPGVGALAIVVRCRNTSGVYSEAGSGFNIWPSFADRPGSYVMHSPRSDMVEGMAGPQSAPNFRWTWGGVAGKRGKALLVAATGDGAHAGGTADGPDGCILFGNVTGPLPAGSQAEAVFYVVPASNVEEAEKLQIWSEFRELP